MDAEAQPLPEDEATPRFAIRQLSASDANRICGGQVVTNLGVAVKELVENSLDAGATTIEVKLLEYGAELIEVVDNGSGIDGE